jgi:hypothetical protein
MSSRRQRRQEFARYRADAGRGLWTYVVAGSDPRLAAEPLLARCAGRWLEALSVSTARPCVVCDAELWSRRLVGALILTVPIVARPTSASCTGLCHTCAALPLATLEREVTALLSSIIVGGKLDPIEE